MLLLQLLHHLSAILPLQRRRYALTKTNLEILGCAEPSDACGKAQGAPTEGTPLQLRRYALHKTNLGFLGCTEPSDACGEAREPPTEGARLASASCDPSSGKNDGGV